MTSPRASRRSLLKNGTATLASALALAPTGAARAMKKLERSGKPRLRLSLAAYSMRKFLDAKPGTDGAMDLFGFIDYAAGFDLAGVELTSYYFAKEITPGYLARLKRHCHLLGLDISSGAIRNNFTLPPDSPEVEAWFDHVGLWLDHYAAIGAPVIRVFAGEPTAGISEDAGIANAIVNLRRACVMAGQRGIILGLENHDFLTKVERMFPIIEAVDSPYFGVNFDSGNVYSNDPYADMARIAPYAVNAQIKTLVRRAGKDEPADLPRVVRILKDAGYRGYIVLEYEGDKDPRTEIPRHLAVLRKAIG